MLWLWLSVIAGAQTFDEVSVRPGWVCSYGAEKNSCAGEGEWAGVAG